MALFCSTCNVGVSSEISMRYHIKGRRHHQAVEAAKRHTKVAQCSLYCRGFPPFTDVSALSQYFSQFGNITRIILDNECGYYCIVHFDNKSSVQQALSCTDHKLSGCKLVVRPRRPITFTNEHVQQSNPKVRLPKVKATSSQADEGLKLAEHEQLMQQLLQADSVVSQMRMLYNSLRLSEEEQKQRSDICKQLHVTLLPFFPTCTIHQFGSAINGYGMHGCDMDIFLDFHEHEISLEAEARLRKKLKPVELPYIREIHSASGTTGPYLPSQLRSMSLLDRVRLLTRILTYQYQCCKNVFTIPSLRCPIARFVHIPTEIKCDLSVNNRLGLQNTQLLRLCSEDYRIQHLVFAVRYWGKWRQLAGNCVSGSCMSNYCLTVLVMHYLASTSPQVIPTVEQLSSIAGPERSCTIEGWNCSLPSEMLSSLNTQTTEELLQGFFQFYSKIDLSSHVLLTREAKTMPLEQFLSEREFNEAIKDFKVKALAVQDPFVLDHNIAVSVNGRTKDVLINEIKTAAEKTMRWKPLDETASSSHDKAGPVLWGLPYLFSGQDCLPSQEVVSSSPVTASHSKSSCAKSDDFACCLNLKFSVLSEQVFDRLQQMGNIHLAWYNEVKMLLIQALKDIFLFSLKSEDGVEVTVDNLDCANVTSVCSTHPVIFDSKDSVVELSDTTSRTTTLASSSEVEGQISSGLATVSDIPISTAKDSPCMPFEMSSTSLKPDTFSFISSDPVSSNVPQSGLADHSSFPLQDGAQTATKTPCNSPSFSAGFSPRSILSEQVSSNSPNHRLKWYCKDCLSSFSGRKRPRGESHKLKAGHGETLTCNVCAQQRSLSGYKILTSAQKSSSSPPREAGEAELNCIPQTLAFSECEAVALDYMPVMLATAETGGLSHISDSTMDTCTEEETDASVLLQPNTEPTRYISPDTLSHHQAMCISDHDDEPSPKRTLAVDHSVVVDQDAGQGIEDSYLDHTQLAKTTKQKDQFHCNTSTDSCPVLTLFCEGKCRTWYGRKTLRKHTLLEEHVNDLELEKLVSQLIRQRDSGSGSEAIRFQCQLRPINLPDKVEAEVSFKQITGIKDFSTFVTFFKSFFIKMVTKYFASQNLAPR